VAAQNLHWEQKGAFTGELSAEMIAASGCTQVIIGHSERRQYFGETEQTVNKKVYAALRAGLAPILCVGETLAQREAGAEVAVVESQLEGGLAGIHEDDLQRIVLAYEPVWAIGTGKTASADQAQAMHAAIRSWLRGRYAGGVVSNLRILYGGSVTPSNAVLLLSQPDIDGALVGGAALKAESFARIVEAAG
jgi:triosephosphate isomerase